MQSNTVQYKVYVGAIDFRREVGILITLEGPNINKAATVAEDGALNWKDLHTSAVYYQAPTIRITEDMAEQLVAALLDMKIKSPTAGAIEGELKATKLHLEDMRRLVRIPAPKKARP